MKAVRNILLGTVLACVALSAFASRSVLFESDESKTATEAAVDEVYEMLKNRQDREVKTFFNEMPSCAAFPEVITLDQYPRYCKDNSKLENVSVSVVKAQTRTIQKANGQTYTRNLPVVSPVIVFDWALRDHYRFSQNKNPLNDTESILSFYNLYKDSSLKNTVANYILERWLFLEYPKSVKKMTPETSALLGERDYQIVFLAIKFKKELNRNMYKYVPYNDTFLSDTNFVEHYLKSIYQETEIRGNKEPYNYISHYILHKMLRDSDTNLEIRLKGLSTGGYWRALLRHRVNITKELRASAQKLAEKCEGKEGCEEYKELATQYNLIEKPASRLEDSVKQGLTKEELLRPSPWRSPLR